MATEKYERYFEMASRCMEADQTTAQECFIEFSETIISDPLSEIESQLLKDEINKKYKKRLSVYM